MLSKSKNTLILTTKKMSVEELLHDLIDDHSHGNLDALTAACKGKHVYVKYRDALGVKRRIFLTPDNLGRIRSIIVHGGLEYSGSSMIAEYANDILFEPVTDIKVIDLMDKKGAFFPYYNLGDTDLSLYQIYRKDQQHNGVHCLIHSLASCGVDTETMDISRDVYTKFPIKELSELTSKIHRTIVVSCIDGNGYVYTTRKFYPVEFESDVPVKLMLWKSHYMVYNRSLLVKLRKMKQTNLFEDIGLFGGDDAVLKGDQETLHSSSGVSHITLISDASKEPQSKAAVKTPYTRKKTLRISCASIVCVTQPHHIPIIYSRYCEGKYYMSSGSPDISWANFRHFLNDFKENQADARDVIYFEDLKYSWAILHKCPYINLKSIIKKDGMYYSVTVMFYGHLFEFRDLSKMIPNNIEEYPKTFDLNMDVTNLTCPNLYTYDTCIQGDDSLEYDTADDVCIHESSVFYDVNSTKTKLTKSTGVIIPDGHMAFCGGSVFINREILSLCPQYFRNNKYYHMGHMEKQAYFTCLILHTGLMVFRERMLKLTEIDCITKLTLPSLIHSRMCAKGCYDDVRESSGVLRKFIAESIHGGRVQSRLNMMWDVNATIKVIDGKSLYPSAIKEICNKGGFPTGSCVAIDNWFDKDTFSHYIVRIRITKVNKIQQLPFISYWEGTSRQYTNSSPRLPVVVDKITLEDWIEFHDIEYEFIEGVQWSNGFNPTAGAYIQELYNSRQLYARDGNSGMSQLCKLCLNSLYGKTITKPNTVKTVIKDNSKAHAYMLKVFDRLIDSEKCQNQTIFTLRDDDLQHSNMGHIGGMILSQARRIMNRPLDIANTLKIPILYMDTDSMHVVDSIGPGLDTLAQVYYQKYGMQLIGQQLGQFAEELSFDVPSRNVHSIRQIVLGKKVYLHIVVGTAYDGSLLTKNHFRIKAINSHAIEEYPDTLKLYCDMYEGETIAFDLAYGDGCIMNYEGSVSIREHYIRKLSFTGDKGTENDLKVWIERT